VAEARRSLTALSLFGYRVDGVVANRVFPATTGDPWLAGWAATQAVQLAEVDDSFAPLPVLRSAYRPSEPVGPEALGELAEAMYGDSDAFAAPVEPAPLSVERSGDEFVLTLALPFADRGATELARSGDELVVTVGSSRRVIALPSALRRCTVVGAVLRDGRLRIRFEPDPLLWMGP
jgi:arsenite-transporting ATPase